MKCCKKSLPKFESLPIWYTTLYNLYMSMLNWQDLPFEDVVYNDCVHYMMNRLLDTGNFGLFENEYSATEGGTIAGSGNLTWYNQYTKYLVTNNIRSSQVDREKLAILRFTPSNMPFWYYIDYYAKILTRIDKTIDINLTAQNTPPIIKAPPGQELTYKNAWKNIAGYDAVVLGYNNLFETSNGQLAYQQPAEYLADKLEMLKHDILNDFFQFFGVTSKPIEKRTVLISDEINADADANSIRKHSILDNAHAFINEVNNIFNCDASVSLNIDLAENTLNNLGDMPIIDDKGTPEGSSSYHDTMDN